MPIVGLENMSDEEIDDELDRGAKFVYYEYCMSFIIITIKQPTDIHFIRAGEGSVGKGLIYVLITLVMGWWGIPFGPIYSIMALVTNLGGGKDVTREVLDSMR